MTKTHSNITTAEAMADCMVNGLRYVWDPSVAVFFLTTDIKLKLLLKQAVLQ
jgi:hypothetical protein